MQSLAQSYVSAGGMGANMHELVAGVDCPHTAAYLDISTLFDSNGAITRSRSICVFELASGMPLRRHYTQVRVLCNPGPGRLSQCLVTQRRAVLQR